MTTSKTDDGESAGRLQAVVEHAFDAIVVADDEGRYVDANPAACELFGLERDELVGRRIDEFAAADYDYEASWRSFREGADRRGLFPLRRPDGEVRYAEYASTRDIRTGEHLSILRDVTERVEKEEALQSRIEQLDQFASMVSHDLRNPLNVAMGHLELYRETGNDDHYDSVVRALGTIEQITEELLTLARRDGREEERSVVSLSDFAREVWEEVDTREATLEVVADRTLLASRGKLRLLLSNLFRNSVGHGGYDVTVRVGDLADVGSAGTGFYVEDTGEGIPEADREAVLESGYSTGYGGSGIGLTIVQQVARAYDWTVVVGEGAEGGARFEFRASAP